MNWTIFSEKKCLNRNSWFLHQLWNWNNWNRNSLALPFLLHINEYKEEDSSSNSESGKKMCFLENHSMYLHIMNHCKGETLPTIYLDHGGQHESYSAIVEKRNGWVLNLPDVTPSMLCWVRKTKSSIMMATKFSISMPIFPKAGRCRRRI